MRHLFSIEWLHIRQSGSFWGTVVVLPLLIGFSLYLGSERVSQQQETIAQLQASEREFYEEKRLELKALEQDGATVEMWWQNPANPLVLGQFGQAGKHVFLEPKPLSALAAGQLDILPYYGRVTLTRAESLRDNALENPFMQVSGSFDFAFVLVWLVPLFVIVMGYNVISSEREGGTFALLQSQPVSMNRILAGKLIFRFLIILGIILVSLTAWSLLFGIDLLNSDGLSLLVVVTAYIAFWFLLCALVNMTKNGSAVNAVSLAGLWVFFLLLLPSFITLIVSTVHPVPSRAMWITEQRAIQQEVEREGDELFDLWIVDHPEEFVEGDTPFFYNFWLRRFIWAETIQKRKQEAEQSFEKPRERQAALAARLRPISPPMTLQAWLERKAGTDAYRLRTLEQEMRSFQQEWQDFFLPRFRRLDFFTSEELADIPSPSSSPFQ